MEAGICPAWLPQAKQCFSVILNAVGLVAMLGAAWLLPGMLEAMLLAAV
jgi:hypothetical protein